LPCRDFWTIYAPGQFMTIAGLFAVVGPGLPAERLWSTLIHLALALAVFFIAK